MKLLLHTSTEINAKKTTFMPRYQTTQTAAMWEVQILETAKINENYTHKE